MDASLIDIKGAMKRKQMTGKSQCKVKTWMTVQVDKSIRLYPAHKHLEKGRGEGMEAGSSMHEHKHFKPIHISSDSLKNEKTQNK